jgi:DNA recombination-dependent growth factor C
MGFIKGGLALSRYRLEQEPREGLADDYIIRGLSKNAFVDIEKSPEETSLGWVNLFDIYSTDFETGQARQGDFIVFALRKDSRRLPAKILNRYYLIEERRFATQTGRKPNSLKKREMKEALRLDLLRRCLLETQILEVIWLTERQEIWLGAQGEKNRALFEELWSKTFGLELTLLVPITLGLELSEEKQTPSLMGLESSLFWKENY